MEESTPQFPLHSPISRRRVLAGLGAAAALYVPASRATAHAAEAVQAAQPAQFAPVPNGDTTAAEDRAQMLAQLGITEPALPPKASDPNAPPNVWPVDPENPEGNWTDALGHFVARSSFGQWTSYDDDTGLAGGAVSPFGAFGPYSHPRYPDIELLRMRNGRRVKSPRDWWMARRPEILRLVEENVFGRIPDRSRWPAVTWSVGPATTGTANGVEYQDVTITGHFDTSGYPQIRNVPVITGTLRTPLARQGEAVPTMVVYDKAANVWPFVASYGYGVFGYQPTLLQPDSGGANLSSYIIGLINKGNWRRPDDWGALAAWGWGISRLVDFFATYPDVDATRIAVQGHSRYGKATLVTAAYDRRIVAAFPSAAGQNGTSWMRRTFGESLENTTGETEYHWLCGNAMKYLGPRHPGRYWPRKVWDMPVDVHCVLALVAPRAVMEACGTDTPPGFGDAWTDPRGMYLSGKVASEVWEFLGYPGQIIPPGTEFTSGPGESIGGTPPIDQYFTAGTIAWGRHHQGHTPYPDWPTFAEFASRYLGADRPAVAAGQRFTLNPVVGTVRAGRGRLRNWQITGGTSAEAFDIDQSGRITIVDAARLDRSRRSYTLTVIAADGGVATHEETITIDA